MRIQSIGVVKGKARCPICGGERPVNPDGSGFYRHTAPGTPTPCAVDNSRYSFEAVTPSKPSSGDARPQRSSRKPRRPRTEASQARYEQRRRRRVYEEHILDEDREPSLQDHDVEDSGRSVRAKSGGLPTASRRSH
ncbi:hypothetical protein [Corynebacterium guangdongense]|uniref:Uncharacterized protein n=1 Tax=Corynebacterium guangdongense TaxID=1783348 RepID=A0ABU1ZVM6_9CORY|nr:hypothetical protein [Corynebacterium guangdongense]MDR7328989.1 hypothetical protein [Corynebacterium guangdongense]